MTTVMNTIDESKDNNLSIQDRQKLVLEITKVFNEICTRHSIWYSLDCGSMLGAVRHAGFIPWDPDMDVLVKIDDVPKIREVLKSDLPENMKLYEWDKVPKFPDGHDCIGYVGHNIYKVRLDIFAIIGTPNTPSMRSWFVRKCFYSYKLFYCKHKDTQYSMPHHVKMIKFIKMFVKFVPDSFIINWYHKLNSKYPLSESEYFYYYASGYGERECMRKDIILTTKLVQFEDIMLPIPVRYHEYLTSVYGDYMIPKKSGYRKFN